MQPSTTRVLASVRDLVTRSIAPLCTSPEAARALALLETSLAHLAGRNLDDRASWLERISRMEELVRRGRRVVGRGEPTALLAVEVINDWSHYQTVELRLRNELANLGNEVARGLLSAAPGSDAHQWLRDVVTIEYDFSLPLAAGAEQTEGTTPDEVAAEKYFSERLAGGEPLIDFEFGTISGGFSRATHTVAATFPDRSERVDLIVRLAGPLGLMDGVALSMAEEYTIIEFAGRAGVPVAVLRWVEENPQILGGSFLVTERAPGKPLGTAVDSCSISADCLREAGTALARLHTAQWWSPENTPLQEVLGAEASLDLRSAWERTLVRWRGFIDQPHISPSPAIVATLEWLSANFPDRDIRPAVVHGDIGFHNMLFDGDRLTALLDWELTDIGDPARDLVAMRRQLADPEDWNTFLGAYEAAGGVPPTPAVMSFYEVWIAVISIMTMMVAAENRFAVQAQPRSEYLELGLMFKPHFLKQLQQHTDHVWSPKA